MLLLMRMITGESWHRVMNDALIDSDYCVIADNYLFSDCGSTVWGFVLFLSYYIICTYIFLNMFVVIVLENFSYFYSEDVKFSVISREDMQLFKQAWANYDIRGKGYIQDSDLIPFLRTLKGRLQVKMYPDNLHVQHISNDIRDCIPNKNMDDSSYLRVIERFRFHFDAVSREDLKSRRIKFNRVVMECMMHLGERGIPFNVVLLVLMNNVIVDQTFLRIDEFIKRKQVLEEIDDKIYLEKANGILKTIIQRRKYNRERYGGSLGGEQIIPQIIIDDTLSYSRQSKSSHVVTASPSASEWSDSDKEGVEEEDGMTIVDKVKQTQYYGIYQELKNRKGKREK